MQIQEVTRIKPLQLDHVFFGKDEVLLTQDAQNERLHLLKRGLALGNLHKEKTSIIFEDYNGEIMEIEASIWAVTEKNIVLKGDRHIPIKRIREVIV